LYGIYFCHCQGIKPSGINFPGIKRFQIKKHGFFLILRVAMVIMMMGGALAGEVDP